MVIISQIELNKVYNTDCLEGMKLIDDKSIDMILADLPYGTTACSWDSIIPLEPLWEQYKRVIKDNGAIVLTASQPFTSVLVTSNLEWFKYEWIWKKSRPTGFAQAKNQPLREHENILIFSNGTAIHACQSDRRMTYNPQGIKETNKIKRQGKNGRTDTCFSKRKSHKDIHIQTETNYPRSVLNVRSEGNTVHPTQKPIELFGYLIKTYTNENEIVLDNTIGSGTTALACLKTDRNFIGFEKEEKYYNIALKRIGKFNKKYYEQLPEKEKPAKLQLF